MPDVSLQTRFQQAIEAFPYYADLDPTGISQGDLETDAADVEYGEEYIFPVGQLLDEKLMAGGWIELRKDGDEEPIITAFFGVARNGEWRNEAMQVLPETTAIQGEYDLEEGTWTLWIDQY